MGRMSTRDKSGSSMLSFLKTLVTIRDSLIRTFICQISRTFILASKIRHNVAKGIIIQYFWNTRTTTTVIAFCTDSKNRRTRMFMWIISPCYDHKIKRPIKFVVLIRTTNLVGRSIW